MNIFNDLGLAVLMDTLERYVDIPIIYTHTGTEYILTASRGHTNWGTLNQLGDVALGENFREYIIKSSKLSFVPSNGDTIKDGEETFEVYNENANGKCWRYCDPYKGLMRIYTRRVKQ
ncbi:MAG: hypothetical protein IJG38_04990 [Thermoguttaceae bacterium]|nr:hypothetical protein [Thermoguttaceae bacterium]